MSNPSVNFVSEVKPDPASPSCHVCGSLTVPVEWHCLACGTNTRPSGAPDSTIAVVIKSKDQHIRELQKQVTRANMKCVTLQAEIRMLKDMRGGFLPWWMRQLLRRALVGLFPSFRHIWRRYTWENYVDKNTLRQVHQAKKEYRRESREEYNQRKVRAEASR